MDLWEATQGNCELIRGDSDRVPIQAALTDNGVLLSSLFDHDYTPLLNNNASAIPAWLNPMSCCSTQSRTFQDDQTRLMILFQDLLTAKVDTDAKTIRLVHCPVESASSRTRADFIIGVRDTAPAEAWDSALAWVAEVAARCCKMSGPRHYLVLINPASGSGNAPQAWATAKALFDDIPDITYEEITTMHSQDVYQRLQKIDFGPYNGIIVVSGDGLVHEVFNALYARQDWKRALGLPVGHIPGGSGNGLATSVLKSCGESYGVLDMAYLIAKGGSQPIDLKIVKCLKKDPLVSFLSLSGAIISDIDIESEVLRFLGGARFTIYALWRVAWPRRLQAELVYWPSSSECELPVEETALDSPLQGEPWVKIEDEFSLFWGCNTSWASSDSNPAPDQAMHDGSWTLVLVRQASRAGMAQILLSLESGEHIRDDRVELIKCRAFRLTPRTDTGNFSLDGELVPFGPIQVWPCPIPGMVLGC